MQKKNRLPYERRVNKSKYRRLKRPYREKKARRSEVSYFKRGLRLLLYMSEIGLKLPDFYSSVIYWKRSYYIQTDRC